MDSKNLIITILLLFLASSLIFSYGLFNQNKIINKNFDLCVMNYNDAISKLTNANNKINQQQQNITQQEKTISELNNEVSKIDEKIEEVKIEINNFQESVDDSTSWFNENSNIKNFKEFDNLYSQLKKCVRATDNICKMKLACFDLINEKYKTLEYVYDDYTSGVKDKLQSLIEFYDNGRGDCEDFSLLVFAEINAMKEFCSEKNTNSFEIEFADYSAGSKYFIDFSEEWYYNNAKKYTIPNDYEYPYIVCGNYPSLSESEKISGHCAVALTNKKINSSNDIYDSLKDSIIFEPQTGFLIFDLRTDNTMTILKNGNNIPSSNIYIWSVISEKDYYLFDRTQKKWSGYEDFIPIISLLNSEIEKLE
jgi:Skp family chaperone for outer membrane proteins